MQSYQADYKMGDDTIRALPLSAENLADAKKQALHHVTAEPTQQIDIYELVHRETIEL